MEITYTFVFSKVKIYKMFIWITVVYLLQQKVYKYALLSRNTVLLIVISSRQNLPPKVLLCAFGCPWVPLRFHEPTKFPQPDILITPITMLLLITHSFSHAYTISFVYITRNTFSSTTTIFYRAQLTNRMARFTSVSQAVRMTKPIHTPICWHIFYL